MSLPDPQGFRPTPAVVEMSLAGGLASAYTGNSIQDLLRASNGCFARLALWVKSAEYELPLKYESGQIEVALEDGQTLQERLIEIFRRGLYEFYSRCCVVGSTRDDEADDKEKVARAFTIAASILDELTGWMECVAAYCASIEAQGAPKH